MDGLLRCARYAFGPNRLHYCGPDANSEILAHIKNDEADPQLATLLRAFQTLHPYLKLIADANGIADFFDERVVEAYWLGNELLDNVSKSQFFRTLQDEHGLRSKLDIRGLDLVAEKLRSNAVPHHSFHVFDIWKRGTKDRHDITLTEIDSCRIGWGKVVEVSGPVIVVMAEPILLMHGKLALGPIERLKLTRRLESLTDIEQLAPGQWVTYHWGVPCEVVTERQAANLKKYTLRHLAIANETL